MAAAIAVAVAAAAGRKNPRLIEPPPKRRGFFGAWGLGIGACKGIAAAGTVFGDSDREQRSVFSGSRQRDRVHAIDLALPQPKIMISVLHARETGRCRCCCPCNWRLNAEADSCSLPLSLNTVPDRCPKLGLGQEWFQVPGRSFCRPMTPVPARPRSLVPGGRSAAGPREGNTDRHIPPRRPGPTTRQPDPDHRQGSALGRGS